MGLECAKIVERLLVPAEQQQMPAQGEPDFLILGRERAGPPQYWQCFAPGAQPVERFRPVQQCFDRRWRELGGLIERSLGGLEPLLPQIEVPQTQICLCPAGLQPDGVAQARSAHRKIALGQLQRGHVVMRFGEPGARASALP